jgi:hypothetical protein
MNLWIVTIGSSDVQLDSDAANKIKNRTETQRSDKVWKYWYTDEVKVQLHDVACEPKQLVKDKDEPYRIAPRVLGSVYQASSKAVQQEIDSYLTFPLLDNFVTALKPHPAPDAIAVLLTDQSQIFSEHHQRRKTQSPYWQDTCELKPILARYFEKNYAEVPCEWITLVPRSADQSLDNWNEVLELVQASFKHLAIVGQKIQLDSTEQVYVSHQAGTPAISSAVQFCSLAQFGDRVQFLVSNEYNQKLTAILPSSNYLIALKRQQAIKLLEHHDYAAVQEVYAGYLSDQEKLLLDAAIQWNFAKFDEFVTRLKQHDKFKILVDAHIKPENWWWTAYEAAYLGVVRLKQGNTVEAMFHSFRAVEGLLKKWMQEYETSQQKAGNLGLKWLGNKIQLPKKVKSKDKGNNDIEISKANSYGKGLYFLLDSIKDIDQVKDSDIWTFGNSVFDRRNDLFHQLAGLQDKEAVFCEWQTFDEQADEATNVKNWKDRVIGCLNFVVKDDLPNGFGSPEEASLMAQVHRELVNAIANFCPQPPKP